MIMDPSPLDALAQQLSRELGVEELALRRAPAFLEAARCALERTPSPGRLAARVVALGSLTGARSPIGVIVARLRLVTEAGLTASSGPIERDGMRFIQGSGWVQIL